MPSFCLLSSPCGRAIWAVMEKLVISSPYICLSQWLVLWWVLSTHPLCSLSNFKASCCSGSCKACRRFCNWSLIQAFTSDKLVKKKLNFQFMLDFTGLGVTRRIRSELVSLKPHKPCFNCIVELQILATPSTLGIWTSFSFWRLGLFVWHLTWTPKWEADLCRVVRAQHEGVSTRGKPVPLCRLWCASDLSTSNPSVLLQDFLPADIQAQFAASRELIRNIYNSFYKLRDRAERIASRAIDNASDLLIFGKELR